MDVVAIYHEPQECGDNTLTFISLETGQVVDRVAIPEGYFYSGQEFTHTYHTISSHVEHIDQGQYPTLENVRTKMHYMRPRHTVVRVTKVTNIQENTRIFPTWTADVHYDICLEKNVRRWDSSKDTFRQEMEEAGFDMTGWCLYHRMRTDFYSFLKQVIPSKYPDFKVINLIRIG